MGDRSRAHQVLVHPAMGGFKGFQGQQKGPSVSKILAVMVSLPVGGGLFALSGITFVGTLIGMAVAFPLFILCSPILVPATLVIGFAVVSLLASQALGLSGVTSLSWVLGYLRQATQAMPGQLDEAKEKMAGVAGFVGQKTKEAGLDIQKKAEGKRRE